MQETSSALIDQLVYIDNFMMNSETPNLDVDGQLSLDLAAFADDSFIFADESKPDPPQSDGEDELPPGDRGPVLGQNQANNMPFDFHTANGSSSRNLDNAWFHEDAHGLNQNVGLDQNPGSMADNSQLHSMLKNKVLARKKERYHNLGSSRQVQSSAVHDIGPELPHEEKQPIQPEPEISNNLSALPKFPVPPGASNSLKKAGLSQNQIDLLSALIAQHQTNLTEKETHGAVEASLQFPPTLVSNGPQQVEHVERRNSRANHVVRESFDFEDSHGSLLPHTNMTRSVVESPVSVNGSDYSSGSISTSMATADTGNSGEGSTLADLDKRRRNTAASARFRIKKKLKEREIEDMISSLNDKIKNFQLRIDELTLENRLLKNLIIEKGERESEEELKLLKDKARYGE